MADEESNRGAFAIQQVYCTTMGAPITALVCQAIADAMDRETAVGARLLDWPGDPTADALPLRTVGGLHALALAGHADLARLFGGTVRDTAEARAIVHAAFAEQADVILPYLDGPPQTNEAGRSGVLMLGDMAVARAFGLPLEVLEIGSSAGFNLLIDRLRYRIGGVEIGPADAPVTIQPEWKGLPAEPAEVRFASVRGVEIAPIDVTDPAQAARLRAYVWADNPDRLARLDAVIAMIRAKPVALEQGDAADWVEARLAEPQAAGTARVLQHSVVWQYLGEARQRRIMAAMEAAGARATAERPLAWVRMEPVRSLNPRMELRVRLWPGDGEPVLLAHAQAHGSWIEPQP